MINSETPKSGTQSAPATAPFRDERISSFLDGWRSDAVEDDGNIAESHLCASDPKLGGLIELVIGASGPRRLGPSKASSHFDAIVRSIVYQQLSKKAAAAMGDALMHWELLLNRNL